MKNKGCVATLLLILLLATAVFVGCNPNSPLGDEQIPNNTPVNYTLYVSGAVENDGFVEVKSGSDYFAAITLAGALEQTAIPVFSSALVNGSITQIILGYVEGDVVYDSVNVNGSLIKYRQQVENVSSEIVNKLANYLETHQKIANRQQLASALGDDYADNYYKFFIAESDYEKAD